MASAVEIVAAFGVTGHKLDLVIPFVVGQTSGDRPEAARIQRFQQHGMGHQAGDAPVTVEKRVNPEKSVMSGRDGEDAVHLAEPAIGGFEALKEAGQCAGAHRNMPADYHVAITQRTWDHPASLPRFRVLCPEQFFGQQRAEAAMNFSEAVDRRGAAGQAALIDPFLDRDMGLGFNPEVPLLGIGAVILLQCSLDIDRMCIVAFDQIAVVAIRRPAPDRQGR